MSRFSQGAAVTWRSQAGSRYKTKTGTVVLVVPALVDPVIMPEWPEATRGLLKGSFDGRGSPRREESYLVKVDNKLYWPRVSGLHLVLEPDQPRLGEPCPDCRGVGGVLKPNPEPGGDVLRVRCDACDGSGRLPTLDELRRLQHLLRYLREPQP